MTLGNATCVCFVMLPSEMKVQGYVWGFFLPFIPALYYLTKQYFIS